MSEVKEIQLEKFQEDDVDPYEQLTLMVVGQPKTHKVDCTINGKPTPVFIDTGADITIMTINHAKNLGLKVIPWQGNDLNTANKKKIKPIGQVEATVAITVDGETRSLDMVIPIAKTLITEFILGQNFNKPNGVIINCGNDKVMFSSEPTSVNWICCDIMLIDAVEERPKQTSKYGKVYATETTAIPGLSSRAIQVDLENKKHVKDGDYLISPTLEDGEIDTPITGTISRVKDELLELDVIEKSRSPWSSPLMILKKSDEKGGGWRVVVDFRLVNNKTKNWIYELPRVEEYVNSLGNSSYFSTIDAAKGYFQVPIREKDKEITAFIVPGRGSYMFKKMPMGAKCSAQTYQALMDMILGPLKFEVALCYLDDVLVVGKTFEIHLKNLKLVLQAIKEAKITLKPNKCIFAAPCIRFLGYVINAQGKFIDKRKIKAVLDLPIPKNLKEVRSFVAFCSYYRSFIPKFAEYASPLTKLTRKDEIWRWDKNEQQAFEDLKEQIIRAVTLSHYDPKAETRVRTDASGVGIGAALTQKQTNKKWAPIAFASRQLNKTEQKYTVTERECLAVVFALNKFKPYLIGMKFTLITDHNALTWLLTKTELPGRLSNWASLITEFDGMDIKHRPGMTMKDVDHLSRAFPHNENGQSIQCILALENTESTLWTREQLIEHQQSDLEIKHIIDRIEAGEQNENYEIHNNILYRKSSPTFLLVIPNSLINVVLYNMHDHSMSGHAGKERTLKRIQERFYFNNMKNIVNSYVESCSDCLTRKKVPGKQYGLMMPMNRSSPADKWGCDVLGPFTRSQNGNRDVIVAIDYYTRYAELKAVPDATTPTIAKFIVENIVAKHGTPTFIVTDRGRCFVSRLAKELFERIGIIHVTTTSFHPRSNLSERINATIATMLSMYTNTQQRDWDEQLSSVNLAINTQFHVSLGTTPFYLMYGRNCRLPLEIPTLKSDENGFDEDTWQRAKQKALEITAKQQEKHKELFDKRKKDQRFAVGDFVMLYSPNRKVGRSTKLLHLWKGPFRVKTVKSRIVYEIEGINNNFNDVVHISRLKKWKPRPDDLNLDPTQLLQTSSQSHNINDDNDETELEDNDTNNLSNTNSNSNVSMIRSNKSIFWKLIFLFVLILNPIIGQ